MEYYIKKTDVVSLLMKEAKSHGLSFSAEAYERAANIVACMPNEDVQPAPKHTENMSTVAFCDRFICKNCDIHLENWVKVVIDPDDGDELHYEYEFKFCPECGARIVEVEV